MRNEEGEREKEETNSKKAMIKHIHYRKGKQDNTDQKANFHKPHGEAGTYVVQKRQISII